MASSANWTKPGKEVVAIVSALAFGCATIQTPASSIPPEIPVDEGQVRPQIELWVESDGKVTPTEAARAAARAQEALKAALANRPSPGEDLVLVVRARGVTRSEERRKDQGAATAALVIGVVTLVVVAVVASSGRGGGRGGGKTSAAPPRSGARPPVPFAEAPRAARPHAWSGTSRPGSPRWGAPARPPTPGAPGWRLPARAVESRSRWTYAGSIELDVGWWWPPAEAPPGPWTWSAPGWDPGMAGTAAASEVPGIQLRPPLRAITLPPLAPLDLDRRGFFEGDLLQLDLTLVDTSGTPVWWKAVEDQVDPCDAQAVRRLLDEALVRYGWVPASGEAEAEAPAPPPRT